MFHLVVTRAFGQYAIGQRITDAAEIEAARANYASNVVPIIAEDAVEPAPPSPKPGKSK